MALDGETQIGRINKHYGGFLQEAYTVADKFGVSCKFFLLVEPLRLPSDSWPKIGLNKADGRLNLKYPRNSSVLFSKIKNCP